MEVNNYLFVALLMLVLLETIIVIGIYGSNRETGVTKKNRYYVIAAILLAIVGVLYGMFRPPNDPLYGIGIAILALALTLIIYVKQENDSEKVLNRIDELAKDLKSRKY